MTSDCEFYFNNEEEEFMVSSDEEVFPDFLLDDEIDELDDYNYKKYMEYLNSLFPKPNSNLKKKVNYIKPIQSKSIRFSKYDQNESIWTILKMEKDQLIMEERKQKELIMEMNRIKRQKKNKKKNKKKR